MDAWRRVGRLLTILGRRIRSTWVAVGPLRVLAVWAVGAPLLTWWVAGPCASVRRVRITVRASNRLARVAPRRVSPLALVVLMARRMLLSIR